MTPEELAAVVVALRTLDAERDARRTPEPPASRWRTAARSYEARDLRTLAERNS